MLAKALKILPRSDLDKLVCDHLGISHFFPTRLDAEYALLALAGDGVACDVALLITRHLNTEAFTDVK